MKTFKTVVITVTATLALLFIIGFLSIDYTLRFSKDYVTIYIDEQDTLDYKAMISPPENYPELSKIDQSLRERVAELMKKNNYKLKNGEQTFVSGDFDPTYEELIQQFIFDPLD